MGIINNISRLYLVPSIINYVKYVPSNILWFINHHWRWWLHGSHGLSAGKFRAVPVPSWIFPELFQRVGWFTRLEVQFQFKVDVWWIYIYICMWYITVVTGILSQCKLSIYTVHPFLPLKKGRPLEMGWSIRPSMVGEWDGDYGIGFTTWMGLVINWTCSYTIHILHHSIFHDNCLVDNTQW